MTTPIGPSDPPRRQATATTGPFSYTDEGEGPVLVAVHGLPGSVRDWRWLAPALPRTVRFVRLDLPGFGQTPLSTGPRPDLDARGAFVIDALEALGIERCVLVGHSMGGGVALAAAAQSPARVAALALVASIGLRPHVMLRRFVGRGLFARAVDVPLVRLPALALLKTAFRATGFPPQITSAEVAHTMRCVAGVDFEVQRRNTTRLTVPTLTAWAEDDPFIEKAVLEEHDALLPPGPRVSWREGGHNVQKSQAVELAAALVTLATTPFIPSGVEGRFTQ